MISSLPTKSRFIGSRTSVANREVISVVVIDTENSYLQFIRNLPRIFPKNAVRNFRRQFAMNSKVSPQQLINTRIAQTTRVRGGHNPVSIKPAKGRMNNKRIHIQA